MAVTIAVEFSPAIDGLLIKLAPEDPEAQTAADPAGYELTDALGDGRYTAQVPPYQGNQPLGRYWGTIYRPGASTFAMAEWFELVDGKIARADSSGAALQAELKYLRDLAEADTLIDTQVSPWAVVWRRKGTNIELKRQQLFDVNNQPIGSIHTFIAKQITPPDEE